MSEEAIREDVCDIIGRELSDAAWARAYEEAKKKLRHIIDRYGDADGARSRPEYMTQLVVEAMRAEAMREVYRGKVEGTSTKAGPHGHTSIIHRQAHKSQETFGYGGHTHENRIVAVG